MYTEATNNTALYDKANPSETIWDSGTTQWDLSGNASTTDWDLSDPTNYTESSSNTVTWTEQ